MSTRTPDYTPQLIEGLLQQIIAILQRDFLANLQAVNPSAGYTAGFNGYHLAERDTYENAPEALIEAASTSIAEDEQESLAQMHTIAVSAVVTGQADTDDLAQIARDYARALVWTLGRKFDVRDYWQPLPITLNDGTKTTTAGMPAGSVKAVVLRNVNWALKGSAGMLFARQPVVELLIVTEEL